MTRERRLRVLVLTHGYPNDLFPTFGVWIAHPTKLLAERVETQVVAPVPYCPPLPNIGPLKEYVRFREVARAEQRDGVDVAHPRYLTGPGHTLYPQRAALFERGVRSTVARIRETFPFDLIHAHFTYPDAAAAHRLAQRYHVPFVITEHAPWTQASYADSHVRREALAAARDAASILAVSETVRATIAAFGIDTHHVRVVPVGVDASLFVPGRREDRRGDQILFVGWPNFNKGIDVLLQAMAQLKQSGAPGRLLLAGGSYYRDTRLQEERLHQLADSLGLGDRVAFVGWQPQEEVARLMAESAVLVLPSRAESFGAVLVEALACGTPVVATRCGGPEEIVRDDVGLLVPTEDVAELAGAISDVLKNPNRYDPQRLRDYAVHRFGWDGIVDEIHSAYVDAVSGAEVAVRPGLVEATR